MNEAQEGITERVDAYTAQRLGGGDAQIAGVLARCEGLTHGEALDVGYGAGFETFALASRFERVVAIDNRADFIRKARRIARDRGVENITFLRHDALEPLPDTHRFDFVYCNNMSHHVASRCRLIARLADAVRPGGWLFMSEEAEGLPPMMIEQALDTRDDVALRVFSRQLINGLRRRPASASADLSRMGRGSPSLAPPCAWRPPAGRIRRSKREGFVSRRPLCRQALEVGPPSPARAFGNVP